MHDNERTLQLEVTAAVTALRADPVANALEFAKLIGHSEGGVEHQVVTQVLAEHGVTDLEIDRWDQAYQAFHPRAAETLAS